MSKTPGKRGPKTEEGKKRVSLNALKHGLHAKSPHALQALESENELGYEKALDIVRTTYCPVDQMEDALVQRIAMCLSRLSMMRAMQNRMFQRYSARSRPGSDFESLLKAERMVSLEFHRCLRSISTKRASELKVARAAATTPDSLDDLAYRYPWSVRSGNIVQPDSFGAPLQHGLDQPSFPERDKAPMTVENAQEEKTSSSVSSHEETEREIVPNVTLDSCSKTV